MIMACGVRLPRFDGHGERSTIEVWRVHREKGWIDVPKYNDSRWSDVVRDTGDSSLIDARQIKPSSGERSGASDSAG